MTLCLAVLSGLLAAAGMPPPSVKSQTPPPALSSEQKQSQIEVELSDKPITVTAPLTVTLKLTAELQAALSGLGSNGRPLRLTVHTVQPKEGDWSGFQVFLNSAKKDRDDLQSPHSVGSVFYYGGKEGEPVNFMFDLGQTIQQLQRAKHWQDGEPLRLTLIGIPSEDKQKSNPPGIVVKKVVITTLPASGS